MKQSLRKILSLMFLSVIISMTAVAQKTMDVQKFTRQDNDLMARVTKPVRDKDEGKLCRLGVGRLAALRR